MKAITIRQPYASRIVEGRKRYECRSWPTDHRGLLAIHAGRLDDHRPDEDLPRHAIIAVARLVACHAGQTIEPTAEERLWGDFTPGQYAWELADVRALPRPITTPGRLSLWRIPDEIVDEIVDQLVDLDREPRQGALL